jgi:hypothetical protein
MELPWAEADAIATAVRNSDPKLLEMEDRVRQRVDQLDSRCVCFVMYLCSKFSVTAVITTRTHGVSFGRSGFDGS